jgi:DNA-binding Xre family transcriptional regulator
MQEMTNGVAMSVSDIIEKALADKGIQKKEIAERMGWSKQNFSQRLKNNSVTAEEWVKIADIIGCSVEMITENGNTVVPLVQGIGPKVNKMVNGYMFDTTKSNAICHSSKIHGIFFELYKTLEERYFLVIYTDFGIIGKDYPVIEISRERADIFISECAGYSS